MARRPGLGGYFANINREKAVKKTVPSAFPSVGKKLCKPAPGCCLIFNGQRTLIYSSDTGKWTNASLKLLNYKHICIEAESHGCIPSMKQGFMLYLLKEPLGFSADCLHMLHASHMKAAGRKQGRSCSQWSFLHAASVFGALGLPLWDQTHTALKPFLCFT